MLRYISIQVPDASCLTSLVQNVFVLLLFKDSEGFPIDIQITDNGDSTYFCVYIPTKPIKHTIIITWGEVNVPNSPFRVRAHCQQADFGQLMTFLCCCLSRFFMNWIHNSSAFQRKFMTTFFQCWISHFPFSRPC